MARQVTTYADIPPVLTQAAADTRYSLVAHNHDAAYATVAHLHTGVYLPVAHEPGVDPHTQYYNQTRGDARYQPVGSYLTTAAAASTYLPLVGGTLSGNLLIGGTRAAVSAQTTGSLSRARMGQIAAGERLDLTSNIWYDGTNWVRDDTASPAAMITLGGGQIAMNNAPSGANPVALGTERLKIDTFGSATFAPAAGYPVVVMNTRPQVLLRWAPGSTPARFSQVINAPIAYLTANVMYDGAQWNLDDISQDSVELHIYGGVGQPTLGVSRMMAGANPVTGPRTKNQLTLSAAGSLTVAPDSGQTAFVSPTNSYALSTGYLRLRSDAGGSPFVDGQTGGYLFLGGGSSGGSNCISIASVTHNTTHIGWGDRGWALVHSVGGVVQDSSVEVEEDISLLDPAACAEAVLGTDWASFSYKTPAPGPVVPEAAPKGESADAAEAREARLVEARAGEARYIQAMSEAAPYRQQKGYILGSPDHKVHDLFGLPTRAHGSPSSDIAVVACALQHCLLEIAELKARLA